MECTMINIASDGSGTIPFPGGDTEEGDAGDAM
jgi:hypothetical protein